jgi:Zn-dependent protease
MTPLIPGVTIRPQSLPYFLASASLAILLHELSHGVLCAIERVKVKNSAILLAVVFFGGAVQPDEEEMKRKEGLGKMRIYAVGSLTNLIIGLLALSLEVLLGQSLPELLDMMLRWVYFLSINLAVINMLPVYPFDGDGILSTFFERFEKRGAILRTATGGGFLTLLTLNMAMSFIKFGITSL